MFRPSGSIVLPFWIKKASLALRMESRFEKIFSIIRLYDYTFDICNIKITSQSKILIVPEEGWFGQPKYSTPTKNHSTLCRLLLLFSSLYTWSRLDHYWFNVHLRDHRSGCLLKCFIDKIPHPSSRFFYHPESGWSCDQPQPGSLFQRLREAERRDPGNEVG